MFDFMRMFKGASPTGASGWDASTVVAPAGSNFTRGLDGGIAGLSETGIANTGKAFGALSKAVGETSASQGAFGSAPAPVDDDYNQRNAQAYMQMLAMRRRGQA